MPLDITFTLSDEDLEHIQEIVDRAKLSIGDAQENAQVAAAARQMIEAAKSAQLPDFIAKRLFKLETVINMVTDEEWQLTDEERGALYDMMAVVERGNALVAGLLAAVADEAGD